MTTLAALPPAVWLFATGLACLGLLGRKRRGDVGQGSMPQPDFLKGVKMGVSFQIVREPEFAKRLIARREEIGLRQIECAERMKLSRQHWNNWELGYCKPRGNRLKKLAALLECDPVWLEFGDKGDLEDRLEKMMLMLRSATREADHIYNALKTLGK